MQTHLPLTSDLGMLQMALLIHTILTYKIVGTTAPNPMRARHTLAYIIQCPDAIKFPLAIFLPALSCHNPDKYMQDKRAPLKTEN